MPDHDNKSLRLSDTLVSILIPAYNAAQTIAETLTSALAQTHASLEIIVVDDGSSDNTASVVEGFSAQDSRVILVQQPNGGVASARNTALSMARGSLVAPLDADDLWHPEKISRQMRRLGEAGSATGVVYCWSADIDGHSRVIQRRLDLDRFEGDVYAALVWTNFIGNASVPLIRRSCLEAIGGWDASLRSRNAQGCEDWQVYLRLAEVADYALEPAFLVGYRQTEQTMSRQIDSMRRSYSLVLNEARERHPELPRYLFRWSEAAFDLYTYELLRGGSASVSEVFLTCSGAFCMIPNGSLGAAPVGSFGAGSRPEFLDICLSPSRHFKLALRFLRCPSMLIMKFLRAPPYRSGAPWLMR